eukprot:m.89416 g.89416  ORF g.89416 m.89416 type:complete len:66 (+) comp12294_c1_seq2:86-283(+)
MRIDSKIHTTYSSEGLDDFVGEVVVEDAFVAVVAEVCCASVISNIESLSEGDAEFVPRFLRVEDG